MNDSVASPNPHQRSPMNARLVGCPAASNPLASIRCKIGTHLTALESHSYTISRFNPFRMTFLRKNGGRGGPESQNGKALNILVGCDCDLPRLLRHQVRPDERIDVAIHHAIHAADKTGFPAIRSEGRRWGRCAWRGGREGSWRAWRRR